MLDAVATYLASEVESVTVGFFFDIYVKVVSSKKDTNPMVLFRSSISPPQSL